MIIKILLNILIPIQTLWEGMDGLDGPVLSGTGFYMKRVALYGTSIQGGNSILCSFHGLIFNLFFTTMI